mgnify:CR=1 FL=1
MLDVTSTYGIADFLLSVGRGYMIGTVLVIDMELKKFLRSNESCNVYDGYGTFVYRLIHRRNDTTTTTMIAKRISLMASLWK